MLTRFFKLISRLVLPRIVVIGLDIQDRHVAAVATVRKGDVLTTLGSFIVELPDEVIVDGDIKDIVGFSNALDAIIAGLPKKIFGRLENEPIFVLSIPPHHIYTETATFPLLDDEALEEAIRLKIETSLPWPITETYFDWSRVALKERNKLGVFIVAVKKSSIDGYLKVFVKRNWKVSACEFHLLSLSKFVATSDDPFMFVLLDEDGAELSVFSGGKIVTHYLQKSQAGENLATRLREALFHLAAFVEGNLGFSVQKAFIFDRAGRKAELVDLQGETRMEISVIESPPSIDPRFFIAQGAAQREYGSIESVINLVAPDSSGRYQENLLLKTLNLWTKILISFTAIFLVVFFSMNSFFSGQATDFLKKNIALRASLDARLSQMEGDFKNVEQFNDLVNAIKDRNELRSHVIDSFRLIADQVVRTGLTLTELRYNDPNEIVLSVIAPTRENALKFKSNLEATQKFASVDIPTSQLIPDLNLNITISMKLL